MDKESIKSFEQLSGLRDSLKQEERLRKLLENAADNISAIRATLDEWVEKVEIIKDFLKDKNDLDTNSEIDLSASNFDLLMIIARQRIAVVEQALKEKREPTHKEIDAVVEVEEYLRDAYQPMLDYATKKGFTLDHKSDTDPETKRSEKVNVVESSASDTKKYDVISANAVGAATSIDSTQGKTEAKFVNEQPVQYSAHEVEEDKDRNDTTSKDDTGSDEKDVGGWSVKSRYEPATQSSYKQNVTGGITGSEELFKKYGPAADRETAKPESQPRPDSTEVVPTARTAAEKAAFVAPYLAHINKFNEIASSINSEDVPDRVLEDWNELSRLISELDEAIRVYTSESGDQDYIADRDDENKIKQILAAIRVLRSGFMSHTATERKTHTEQKAETDPEYGKWYRAREKCERLQNQYLEEYREYLANKEKGEWGSVGFKVSRWAGLKPRLPKEIQELKDSADQAVTDFLAVSKEVAAGKTYDAETKSQVIDRYQRLLARKLFIKRAEEQLEIQKSIRAEGWQNSKFRQVSEWMNGTRWGRRALWATGYFTTGVIAGASGGVLAATLAGAAAGAGYAARIGGGTLLGKIGYKAFNKSARPGLVDTSQVALASTTELMKHTGRFQGRSIFDHDYKKAAVEYEKLVFNVDAAERKLHALSQAVAAFSGFLGGSVTGALYDTVSDTLFDQPAAVTTETSKAPVNDTGAAGRAVEGGSKDVVPEAVPKPVPETPKVQPDVTPKTPPEHLPLNDPRDDQFNLENDATGSGYVEKMIEEHNNSTSPRATTPGQADGNFGFREASEVRPDQYYDSLGELANKPSYTIQSNDTFEFIVGSQPHPDGGLPGIDQLPTVTRLHNIMPEVIDDLVRDAKHLLNNDGFVRSRAGFGSIVDKLEVGKEVDRQILEYTLNKIAIMQGHDVPDSSQWLNIPKAYTDAIDRDVSAMFAPENTQPVPVPRYIPDNPPLDSFGNPRSPFNA